MSRTKSEDTNDGGVTPGASEQVEQVDERSGTPLAPEDDPTFNRNEAQRYEDTVPEADGA